MDKEGIEERAWGVKGTSLTPEEKFYLYCKSGSSAFLYADSARTGALACILSGRNSSCS